MSFFDLLLIAVGLSMDSFAVSICKGLTEPKFNIKTGLLCGLWFGVFQGGMPVIGYFLGGTFYEKIADYDHWIALFLLAFIGVNMIKESRDQTCDECQNQQYTSNSFSTMLMLAVATSIDALTVGISFAFLHVNILTAGLLICCTTFFFSFAGVKIGNLFGTRYKSAAELTGGIILIILGLKIFLEHTGFI